jgi:hypothetical protein
MKKKNIIWAISVLIVLLIIGVVYRNYKDNNNQFVRPYYKQETAFKLSQDQIKGFYDLEKMGVLSLKDLKDHEVRFNIYEWQKMTEIQKKDLSVALAFFADIKYKQNRIFIIIKGMESGIILYKYER